MEEDRDIDIIDIRPEIQKTQSPLIRLSARSVMESDLNIENLRQRSTASPTCTDEGVIGMLPGIIGTIQALETIKIIFGIKPNLSGKLLLYDGITHTMQQVDLMNG